MAGTTNRGKMLELGVVYRNATPPTNFYIALVTDAIAPGADTNVLSDLQQIPVGNGYVDGGYQLNRNSTDFDTLTESDPNDWADLLIKDVSWLAAGGNLPLSGTGARYAVLTDDNATVANREVWRYWSLGSNRIVSDGQTLTLRDFVLRNKEA